MIQLLYVIFLMYPAQACIETNNIYNPSNDVQCFITVNTCSNSILPQFAACSSCDNFSTSSTNCNVILNMNSCMVKCCPPQTIYSYNQLKKCQDRLSSIQNQLDKKTKLILGLAIGIPLFVLVVVVIIVLCLYCRKKPQKQQKQKQVGKQQQIDKSTGDNQKVTVSNQNLNL